MPSPIDVTAAPSSWPSLILRTKSRSSPCWPPGKYLSVTRLEVLSLTSPAALSSTSIHGLPDGASVAIRSSVLSARAGRPASASAATAHRDRTLVMLIVIFDLLLRGDSSPQ